MIETAGYDLLKELAWEEKKRGKGRREKQGIDCSANRC